MSASPASARIAAWAAVAVLAWAPTDARADLLSGASVPAEFRQWTVEYPGGDVDVSQFNAPLTASARLGAATDLVVTTSGAWSRLESASEAKLGGLSTIGARVFTRVANGRVLLQGMVTAPSGSRGLSTEEFQVARAVGLPLLGFAGKVQGSGFEGGAGATMAFPLNEAATLALGVGGIVRGAFELLEGDEDLRPAPEAAATAGLDLGDRTDVGPAPVRIEATYRWFGEDEMDGTSVFQEGAQVELQVASHRPFGNFDARATARAIFKGENRAIGTGGTTVGDYKASSGDALSLLLGFAGTPRARLRAGFDVEVREVHGADEFGRDGLAFGVGPSAAYALAEGVSLEFGGSYLFGSLDGPTGEDDATMRGFAIHGGLRFGVPR